jgi:hypothetical protein
MNRSLISAAVVAAAAFSGAAFAESPTVVKDTFVSTKTRAEVQADLSAYKQAGVNHWSTSYNPLRGFKGTKTRAEVTAEYVGARDQVAALTGEDSGSAWLSAAQPLPAPATLAGRPANAQ